MANGAPRRNNDNSNVNPVTTETTASSLISSDAEETLSQVFDKIFKKRKTYESTLKEIQAQYTNEINEQERAKKIQIVKEWGKLQAQLVHEGLLLEDEERQKLLASNKKEDRKRAEEDIKYREKLEKKFQLSKYKEQVQNIIKLAKEQGKISTPLDKVNKWNELSKNVTSNIDTILSLNKLSKTRDLTDEEKAVKKQATKEAAEGILVDGLKTLNRSIQALTNMVGQGISTYTQYQTGINARMQGADLSYSKEDTDYYAALFDKLTDSVGVSPYFKTEDLLANMNTLIEAGIASNVEQRAFLQTAKEGIATTFDAANSALLRIIRLQQSDSTAARLGMEAYLTRFLNELVSNTEYLTTTFDNVEQALIEASSQMSAQQATEFEYVVQKWLGTLTGVGLSEETATNIATAIGYLGSGDINNLNSSSVQNLLVMAASQAGLDYSQLLTEGLDAYKVNDLMKAMTEFMINIGQTDNNVVRSQYASTFGINVSDLTAVENIAGDTINTVYDNLLSYNGMYSELNYQMSEMSGRMNEAVKMQNSFSNFLFQLSGDIASNPATAALWQITDLIQSVTGGINIPYISAFGSGIDLNTTVENLMKIGIVGASTLGNIGDLISGVNQGNNTTGILNNLGITSSSLTNTIARGSGLMARDSGMSTSQSSFVGNSDSSTLYDSTLNAAYDSGNQQLEQQMEETDNPPADIREYLTETLENHMVNLIARLENIQNNTLEPSRKEINENMATLNQKLNDIRSRLDGEFIVEVSDYGLVGIQ